MHTNLLICDVCKAVIENTPRATSSGVLCEACFSLLGLPEEYITRAEAARLLGVSEPTVSRWLLAGKMKAYRYGERKWRIPRSSVYSMIEST